MLKITKTLKTHQFARRPSPKKGEATKDGVVKVSAWVPIDKRDIPLPSALEDALNAALLELPGNVTHLVNDGAITFYDGENPVFVSGNVVQTLQWLAEVIEARMIAKLGPA